MPASWVQWLPFQPASELPDVQGERGRGAQGKEGWASGPGPSGELLAPSSGNGGWLLGCVPVGLTLEQLGLPCWAPLDPPWWGDGLSDPSEGASWAVPGVWDGEGPCPGEKGGREIVRPLEAAEEGGG